MKNLIAKKNLIQQKVKYMKRKIKRIQAVCIYMMLLLLLLLPQTVMAKNTEKSKTTFPVQVIHKTGDDKENFVIVIMGDGYTAGQQEQFLEDATQKARGMLTWSPYREYSDRINIYAVQAVSNESGIGVYGGKSPDTYFHVKVYGKAAGFTNGGDERAKALRTELKYLVQRIINNCYIKQRPLHLHGFHPFYTSSDKPRVHGSLRQSTCKFVLPTPVWY